MKFPNYHFPPPLSRPEIRDLDARAIAEFGIPGLILMENAAEGCVRVIERLFEQPSQGLQPPFQIIAGFGNNGGDGLAIARHLFNRGLPARVYLTAPAEKFQAGSDAALNLEIARRLGVPIFEGEKHLGPATAEGTIVDAIFGSGLSRPVAAPEQDWIEAINRSGLPVLSIDIPSGLDADSGEILGAAVRARHTLTIVAPKRGFYRASGPECTGTVHLIGISIPRPLLEKK
ncbi:MAG: NAD(P)H-hydrate epimerase [Planctomycetes bacterium]|nr:NAD(P)H-hydrate epimerase [Planctomycetota bacterium]